MAPTIIPDTLITHAEIVRKMRLLCADLCLRAGPCDGDDTAKQNIVLAKHVAYLDVVKDLALLANEISTSVRWEEHREVYAEEIEAHEAEQVANDDFAANKDRL